jgi:hypothetical protein
MLQMTSLIDEASRRTTSFERSAADLTSVAGVVAARLPEIEGALNTVGEKVGGLSKSTAEIADGNKGLVSAFNDLHSAGQKLKSLGHSITGHFNIWQEQTRKVYGKAQESTEKIEMSFARMGETVFRMEGLLRDLSTGINRGESGRNRGGESVQDPILTTEHSNGAAAGDELASSFAGPIASESVEERVG